MTTVTLTQARAKLLALVKRARQGEDIGILSGDQIVALRVVPVVSVDLQPLTPEYVAREYGLTPGELSGFKKRQARANASARRKRAAVTFRGEFDPKLLD
jgi:antitoxin (DNA-binding transcriptional repressor) of toxin-antitoxin stability system